MDSVPYLGTILVVAILLSVVGSVIGYRGQGTTWRPYAYIGAGCMSGGEMLMGIFHPPENLQQVYLSYAGLTLLAAGLFLLGFGAQRGLKAEAKKKATLNSAGNDM
jgi:hypothetical protein